MSNIYFIGLKKRLVLGVLDIEEIRDKDIEMSTTSAFHIRDARSLRF